MTLKSILAIGTGGFIGAILRYLVEISVAHTTIPLSTLIVNLLGSFILGSLFAIFMKVKIDMHLKSLLSTGMMGAFTTYSTFALQSFLLMDKGDYFSAFLNMSLNLFGTVLFAGLGFVLFEKILKEREEI